MFYLLPLLDFLFEEDLADLLEDDFLLPLLLRLLLFPLFDREDDLALARSDLDNNERLFSDESTLDPLATEKAKKVAMKSTPLNVR